MRTVERTTKERVTVAAPPSKAHTLRALFISALGDGRSVVINPLLGRDQEAAIECLRRLGVTVVSGPQQVIVHGCDGRFDVFPDELFVEESGVGMHFLTALACLCAGPVTVTGATGLLRRPIGELVDGLRQLGCRIDYLDREGFPPVRVHGGGIPGGSAALSGELSSQHFSAILAVAPCAAGAVRLKCRDSMSERPYVDITIAMMAEFGAEVERDGYSEFAVTDPAGYRPSETVVEGDYSSAAFFFEAAAVCGNRVTVTGLAPTSLQGDRRFLDILEEMGCAVEEAERGFTVAGGELSPVEADMGDTPDLVPPLAVTAAFAPGTSRLSNVARLEHKESDRPAVIVEQLGRMGIEARVEGDALVVEGGEPRGAEIEPHNDHRIAMAFAVAGLAVGDQAIREEACVAKSFPDFWARLQAFH